ncbi:putative splicing factor 3A subunit 1 [Dichanthelium oligosanthes]|uniref:Putative splicing factor 3A subunit 1 n=1 Tax=Dichanthelium oligosanthes TaxID=888268 RepID=A0A1E5UK60_9POAL|nr:putative splicing factor 3A subunit 1 [Dichanthelium oligosanthes]
MKQSRRYNPNRLEPNPAQKNPPPVSDLLPPSDLYPPKPQSPSPARRRHGKPILTLPAPVGNIGDDDHQHQAPPPPPPPSAKADPPATVATHTRTIGIIHPPPDIRVIIEKTATFVAKNGPEFERRIISLNQGNAKFNFLQPSDPYHAYYQHRVAG